MKHIAALFFIGMAFIIYPMIKETFHHQPWPSVAWSTSNGFTFIGIGLGALAIIEEIKKHNKSI